MRAILATVIASGLAMTAVPAMAQGTAPFDHYKCYRVKDEAKFKALVDLTAFQTQFNVDPQCAVKGRAKIFCVPVVKDVLKLSYPPKSTLTPITMPGQDLQADRLCYKIKCPATGPIAAEEVQDQFGRRKVGKFRVSMLCTNAIKTSTTSSTTTTTIPQQDCSLDPLTGICGGLCPNSTDVCMTFPGGLCDCVQPCAMDAAGACGGQCPSGQTCQQVSGTACQCQ